MKWFVLLLALAGVVFPAYATTSPPVNVSITITSSGSTPCDVGPNYAGSIPAAATQAGFTHCAANYDFTQTQQWTDIFGTHTWSNLSTWLDCNRNSAMASPILFVSTGSTPCDTTHINIVSDGGTQVLALSYLVGDKNANNFYNIIQNSNNSGGIVGASVPVGKYYENVVKVSSTSTCSNGCIIYDTSTYAPNAFSGSNPCFIEVDAELWSTPLHTNTGVDYWNPVCGTSGNNFGPALNSPPAQNPSTSAYTTYGILMTVDNVNTFGACNYSGSGVVSGLAAGSFLGCATEGLTPGAVFTARNGIFLVEGPQSTDQGGGNWTAASETTYIQRFTIWVCPNPSGGTWQTTGQCYNNPVITTHP